MFTEIYKVLLFTRITEIIETYYWKSNWDWKYQLNHDLNVAINSVGMIDISQYSWRFKVIEAFIHRPWNTNIWVLKNLRFVEKLIGKRDWKKELEYNNKNTSYCFESQRRFMDCSKSLARACVSVSYTHLTINNLIPK